MDRFVTHNRKKECEIIGRETYVQNIKSLLEKNASFCVYGPPGVGKTTLVKFALQGFNYVELTSELLKEEFTGRLKNATVHVLADGLEVFEPVTLGSTVVISDAFVDSLDCIRVEPLSFENMFEIGRQKYPHVHEETVQQCALVSKGDIRSMFFKIENFKDEKDIFKSPKDFVYDLVCKGGCLEPRTYIGKHVMEHGYSWGIVHENYVDAPGVQMDKIADMMSLADIEDEEMYNGFTNGNMFSLFGIVMPAIQINHSLEKSTMRPGSAWTKYNNYRMRHRRYRTLSMRSGIDVDALMTLSQYCKSDPNSAVFIMKHYGFEPADVDMMNHISLIHKIKPRPLQNIKTKLKSICNT
jgi:hypothetical protein